MKQRSFRFGFDRVWRGQPRRRCAKCGKWHPLERFAPDPHCALGRQYRCYPCKAKYQREERAKRKLRAIRKEQNDAPRETAR